MGVAVGCGVAVGILVAVGKGVGVKVGVGKLLEIMGKKSNDGVTVRATNSAEARFGLSLSTKNRLPNSKAKIRAGNLARFIAFSPLNDGKYYQHTKSFADRVAAAKLCICTKTKISTVYFALSPPRKLPNFGGCHATPSAMLAVVVLCAAAVLGKHGW